MLITIFDIWEKLPSHARIIVAVGALFAMIIKPTILLIQWIRQIIKNKKLKEENPDSDTLNVPFSIKISGKSRKIRWYKETLSNHNIFFQLSELIKYEIDTNRFSFGDSEKTRLFRQLMRIYLGVLHDSIKKPLDSKINLDSLNEKQLSELFSDFIQETNSNLDRKFKENFTDKFYNLVIMNEEKGFTHFIEKNKKYLILSIKEIIHQDTKLYDSTNYRKLWEIYSLIRLLLNVGLESFIEFYENFNGDLDDVIKKSKK